MKIARGSNFWLGTAVELRHALRGGGAAEVTEGPPAPRPAKPFDFEDALVGPDADQGSSSSSEYDAEDRVSLKSVVRRNRLTLEVCKVV